jgi:hypothetical protein
MPKISEQISNGLHLRLNKLITSFKNKQLAAEYLGISRQCLHRVLTIKSAKPETVSQIKKHVNKWRA